ncbi:MAG: sigma-54-dependent Fis family transcriptional regulator [Holophagaceae bacterium]|nr:sigma-54-dependent Fis family transcriptional regulator [Holophagaceae bacterium]
MAALNRLHWSTLGESSEGLENAWASAWEVSVDRGASPALPPRDTDLWAISASGTEPPTSLLRLMSEVSALPILLLQAPGAPALSPMALAAWGRLGSVRWGLLNSEIPQGGLRPLNSAPVPFTATQALALGLVGFSPAMAAVVGRARAAAATRATVLLSGESGSGKEVIARAIHQLSEDREQPFVAVHCGAIPENLVESELFGYNKGAFTDARKDTPGKFREANGGTLFLDEVGTMPLSAQVRLLRVLQEREVQPLGGGPPVKVDVRVVVATNSDLWGKVQDGSFREDLFYRLDVVPIQMPPLRSRREEVPFLAQHFLNRKAREHGLYPKALHPSVDPLLMSMPWPGNVRQLENAIERAVILAGSRPVLTRQDFTFLMDRIPEGEILVEEAFQRSSQGQGTEAPSAETLGTSGSEAGSYLDIPPDGLDLNHVVSEVERNLMLQSLAITRGNKKRAAELLGLKRTTFLEKMKRLELEEEGAEVTDGDSDL